MGISPSKRRKLKRIFLEIDCERIKAWGVGEDYEVIGDMIIARSIRELGLTHNDSEYIKEKGLDEKLST